MSGIAFLLNGTPVRVEGASPTRTLLDWLREDRGLCGTKEGCNEGDCGACTVMVTDAGGRKAVNACILFLPQLQGKAVRTVEGMAAPDGALHPVQAGMVECHGSQCGFCTPGFIVSMATAHLNGAADHDDQLAGNLCRCTGYAPIIRAAEAAGTQPVPAHMAQDSALISARISSGDPGGQAAPGVVQPTSSDDLADWYVQNPDMLIGRMGQKSNGYGLSNAAIFDGDIGSALRDRIARLPEGVHHPRAARNSQPSGKPQRDIRVAAPEFVKPGAFCLTDDGRLAVSEGQELLVIEGTVSAMAAKRIVGMMGIRDAAFAKKCPCYHKC